MSNLRPISPARKPYPWESALAAIDRAHMAFSGPQAAEIYAAREAVAQLIGAAQLVTGPHDMATVKGRMEMQRRLNVLAAALGNMGSRR